MAESMTFTLRGRDELSRVLNGAGDAALRMQRRIEEANARSSRATMSTQRQMDGSLRGLVTQFSLAGEAGESFGDALASVASKSSGLGPVLAAAGVSAVALLPAIGGLVPMLTGFGVAGVTAAVVGKSMSKAWDASEKSGKKFTAAIKDMPKTQRELAHTFKDLRKEFKTFGDDILAKTLPGITKGFESAMPATRLFKDQMMKMGGTFGDLARDAGKALGSKGLRKLLGENMDMGREFIDTFTRSLGDFGVSLLDFGSKSEKSFDALNGGISDLLSKGLPGFFKGLVPGISGAAKGFDGLFSMVNNLLPAFGRFAGTLGKIVGPALGSFFNMIGKVGSAVLDAMRPALEGLKPLFDIAKSGMNGLASVLPPVISAIGKLAGVIARIATAGLKNLFDMVRAAGPIVGSLAGTIGKLVSSALGLGKINGSMGWLDKLSNFAHNNRNTIQRVMQDASNAVLNFTGAVVNAMPTAFGAFRMLATVALRSIGSIITGLAKAFSGIPGIGPKLAKAAVEFGNFARGAEKGMGKAQSAMDGMRDSWNKQLPPKRLEMNIDMFNTRIATVKSMLNDPSLSKAKKIELRAELSKLMGDKASAERALQSIKPKVVDIKASAKTAAGVEMANKDLFRVKDRKASVTARNGTAPGIKLAQGTINSLRGVSRDAKSRNAAHPGVRLAQGTINGLRGATRDLKGRNSAHAGKSSAQGTINSLKGKSVDLKARNATSSGVSAAKAAIASVVGKTVTIAVKIKKALGFAGGGLVPGFATGGQFGVPGYATGGPKRFPTGGRVTGPGTTTSDSINAKLSTGEFVIRAAAVNKYGAGLFHALNTMQAETAPVAARTTGAVATAPVQQVTNHHTTNVYPQRANFGVDDLDTLQRVQETRARIGRPH